MENTGSNTNRSTPPSCEVFLHVATLGHWRDLARAMYARIAKFMPHVPVTLSVVGEYDGSLDDLGAAVFWHGGTELYEFPTLRMVHRSRRQYVLYLHTKGVSLNEQNWTDKWAYRLPRSYDELKRNYDDWLEVMLYFCVERHAKCLQELRKADICGVHWTGKFFPGNFWWARTRYLAKLPEPALIQDRYDAELWVGSGKCIAHDMFHFECPCPICGNATDNTFGNVPIPRVLYREIKVL